MAAQRLGEGLRYVGPHIGLAVINLKNSGGDNMADKGQKPKAEEKKKPKEDKVKKEKKKYT